MTTFNPDWVVCPGSTLADCMDERGFEASEYADGEGDWLFGITHAQMRGLLAGDEPLDDDLATKLARLTGVPSRMWLALEHNYRVGLAAGKKRSL